MFSSGSRTLFEISKRERALRLLRHIYVSQFVLIFHVEKLAYTNQPKALAISNRHHVINTGIHLNRTAKQLERHEPTGKYAGEGSITVRETWMVFWSVGSV